MACRLHPNLQILVLCIFWFLPNRQPFLHSITFLDTCQKTVSTGSSLVLSCNIRSYVIELDYGYRYLLEVCFESSDIYFLIWLRYHSMFTLHDRPVHAMVNISVLELYQLLQYSYVFSSVMSVHPCGILEYRLL